MKISYDKQADVMYVWFSLAEPPYINVENQNGDIVRIKDTDGEVVGLIIYDALYRMKNGKAIEIPEVGSTPMNDLALALLKVAHREHVAI